MRKLLSSTYLALTLSIAVTCLWVFWGVIEMFHEGWYAPFEWLFFLLPAGVMFALTLIALRLPRVGAILFAAIGIGFGALVLWQYRPGGGRSAGMTLGNLLSWVPVWLFPVVIGILYYLGRGQPRRRIHYLAAIGAPALLGLALAIEPAYRLSQRVDDGYLGERFIQGNGVALYWAPAGHGWNRSGGLTWNEIALYGRGGVGLTGKRFGMDGLCNGVADWTQHCATTEDMQFYNVCLYLDRDGIQLMPTKQGIWRMPTTDELVRSLTRSNANSRCAWNRVGGAPRMDATVRLSTVACEVKPDKETPLWDPRSRVIYYWAADEASAGDAYIVVYNGEVWEVSKFTALGSRGYRCVRQK